MNVIFICTGNSFRSPVAEALLKKLKPGIEMDSAGTNPSAHVSEAAMKYLEGENAEKYLKSTPESLNEKQLNKYDLIIVMKSEHKQAVLEKCVECKDKIVVWNIDDPYFLPPEYAPKISEKIRKKVTDLANAINRSPAVFP